MTKSLRTILIEDEPIIRRSIRTMIETEYSSCIEVIAEIDNVPESIETITAENPDLVLLDVTIRKGTALDILNAFQEIDFMIVFLTASPEFVQDAFEVSAIDYLLKPMSKERFRKAMSKAIAKKRSLSKSMLPPRYIVRSVGLIELFRHEEIIRFEGDGNCTKMVLADGRKRIVSSNLGKIEDELWNYGYMIRIHQSHIINGSHLLSINRSDKEILLRNGESIMYSRGFYNNLYSWLDGL